jgi:hypothetical protein
MSRRRLLAAMGLALSLAVVPSAHADGRPPDASGTVCTYRGPEATPYDTPQGHIKVHYVADPSDRDAPAPGSTRVAGVPDWVVAVGDAAEAAWARETALGFPAPPADDGDGAERGGDARYDLYVCDLASHDLGELAATVPDPSGSGFSYIVVDNDYAAAEVAPLTTTGLEQLRVTVAHELFHAIQLGESHGRLPEWLAESTAVWMEGIVAPPDVDREIYRVALGGAGTEEPYWKGGDLHEYGAWWLVEQLEASHPGFVRRLLEGAASRSDADSDGLQLVAAAVGGTGVLERDFRRFARTALDDPLVGRALRARSAPRLGAGGRLVLRASVPPLGLMLWRVPSVVTAVTVRRSGGAHAGVVLRRGSSERPLQAGSLRLASGRGSLYVLVVGGASSRQDIRLVLSS